MLLGIHVQCHFQIALLLLTDYPSRMVCSSPFINLSIKYFALGLVELTIYGAIVILEVADHCM